MSVTYEEAIASLTAAGGAFAITQRRVRGQDLKVFELSLIHI